MTEITTLIEQLESDVETLKIYDRIRPEDQHTMEQTNEDIRGGYIDGKDATLTGYGLGYSQALKDPKYSRRIN